MDNIVYIAGYWQYAPQFLSQHNEMYILPLCGWECKSCAYFTFSHWAFQTEFHRLGLKISDAVTASCVFYLRLRRISTR